MRKIPNPILKDVIDWPYYGVGVIDVVDGQSSDADCLESFIKSFWSACILHLPNEQKVGFSLDGEVLFKAGIRPDELDQGLRFKVGIIESKGPGIPVGERDVGLVYYQDYEAVEIERV